MFIEVILTAAAVVGLILFYWSESAELLLMAKCKINLFMNGVKIKDAPKPVTKAEGKNRTNITLVGSVQKLLGATIKLGTRRAANIFIGFSVFLGVFVFYILKDRTAPFPVYVTALTAMLLPTIMLVCRLQGLRIASSHEGDVLIAELLDNYKMNYFNMQQAIEVTAMNIKEAPHSKRLVLNLSKGLNTASDPREIKSLLSDFEFAIGTSWAGVMADNMYFALVSGIRVTNAMEDLIKTIENAGRVQEFAARENNEGRLILKYLAPACYVLTVVFGIKCFGLAPEEFFRYQFMTAAGVAWFVTALISYICGITAGILLSRSKMDI